VPLNRIARILQAGHGGQILLSQATQELVRDLLPVGVSLQDLGEQRLRDLVRPERLFQAVAPGLPADFPSLRSPATFRHNLPQPLTSFIGRERELAEAAQLLETGRLVTLTGAGGCGKTRLSLQVAAGLLEQFRDGIWFVELAALTDPALLHQTVATVLGLREESGRSLEALLLDYLREKRLLLVLDNCEHLLIACAQLADTLLRACPGLQILASSREGLGVSGEQTYRVPSLSVPESRPLLLPEQLLQFEAVQLFADRAALSQPSFTLTPANAPAVTRICHRLDGIPLAIELAAARVKALPLEQIAARLDDRFRLLTGGSRTALPRQQTLRALIDWSYDLLTEPERTLLRRLSVFAGGWDLEAAEAVCAGDGMEEWEVLDRLTALVEKSLVLAEEAPLSSQGRTGGGFDGFRYRLLETVRQYGRDRLLEMGEEEALRRRHRDWFLALAERAEPEIRGPAQVEWMERLEREHDNLRAALTGCLEGGRGEGEAGLRLAGALTLFWYRQNSMTEGWQWLKRALDLGARGPVRVKVVYGLSILAFTVGGHSTLASLAAESLSLARASGNPRLMALALLAAANAAHHQREFDRAIALGEEGLARAREAKEWALAADALQNLAMAAGFQGDLARAKSSFTEALALAREMGDQRMIAWQLNNLGWTLHLEGDDETARALCEESVSIVRKLGGGADAQTLHSLGDIVLQQGDLARAAGFFRESLEVAHRAGYRMVIPYCLEGIGAVEAMSGRPAAAARLYGAAAALREAINILLSPDERGDYERKVAAARAAASEPVFAAAWAEGRAMEWEEAVQYALEGANPA
jgi:predicted ATPase